MSFNLERLMQSHGAMLCGMTLCTLFMRTASVYSKQTPTEPKVVAAADPFALKNPNAFDPARRRTVRAIKIPRETAAHMASGIDAAEHPQRDPDFTETEQPPSSPRVAEATR